MIGKLCEYQGITNKCENRRSLHYKNDCPPATCKEIAVDDCLQSIPVNYFERKEVRDTWQK
jgi:hypothetical protein